CVDLYRCLRQLSVQRLTPAEAVSSTAHADADAELRTPPVAAEPYAGDASSHEGRARTLSYPRIRTCAGGSRHGERAVSGGSGTGRYSLRSPCADTVAPADDFL